MKTVSNINKKLQELSIIYIDVKNALLLSENITNEKSIALGSINEMRNALDHIMRAYIEENGADIHFGKAKGHLYRAGYDAYEILAIDVAQNIKNLLNNYKADNIVAVLPEYYTEIIPTVHELERKLVEARGNKYIYDDKDGHIDPTKIEQPYLDYQTHSAKLIEINDRVIKLIPSFEAKKKAIYKATIFDKSINLLVGFSAGMIGAVLIYYFKLR